MYLFSRQARFAPGQQTAAFDWGIHIGELVQGVTGLHVELWTTVLSPEVGRVAWTAWVEDLATVENAFDKLLADPSYIQELDKGAQFIAGGADDSMFNIISGEADLSRHLRYASTVTAVLASGSAAKGMEVGVKIAQLATEITGEPTLFGAMTTGPYGSIGWLTGYEDIAHVESSEQKLMADERWLKLLDKEVGQCYVEDPALTQQLLYRKIA